MAHSIIDVHPIHDRIIVGIYDDGETEIMLGGKKFFLLDDTRFDKNAVHKSGHQRHKGIRPRWAIVLATPDELDEQNDIEVGQKVLLEFGEWSRAVPVRLKDTDTKVWSIKVDRVLGRSSDFEETEKEKIRKLYPFLNV